jgi:hypothetical protein
MFKKAALLLLTALFFQAAGAAEDQIKTTSFLDGVWEGTLTDVGEPANRTETFKVRLHIKGGTAQMFAVEQGKWMEFKPGQFKVFQHNFNAVAFAHDSPGMDCWDETMSHVLVLDTSNRLIVKYSRVVSNIRCLSAEPDKVSFGRQSAGVLTLQP